MIKKVLPASLILAIAYLATGCAINAPSYNPNMELTSQLRKLDLPKMTTGSFTEAEESMNSLTLRGAVMKSPYDSSYGNYLQYAIDDELKQSSLWDSTSNTVITGKLVQNDVNIVGISVGKSDLSANFVVTKDGEEVYNKTHAIHHEWGSSFLGSIAVSNAQQNYPVSIRKLLQEFMLDEVFVQSVTK